MERSTTHRGRSTITLLAFVLAASLIAAGCAKDNASTPSGESVPPATVGAQTNITQAASGAPKTGGDLAYAVEAETSGWNPTTDRWAISGVLIGLTVFDPLASRDDKGVAQPYLAKSWESSSDFKTWKITLRSGITFHDGTPLTADAVKTVYDAHLKSGLTRPAFGPLQSVDVVDPLTVQFNMSVPWAVFPGSLTGQQGVIAAPAQLASGDASSSAPIGTGPFKFQSWTRDDKFVAAKYPNYWRKDQQGNQMPYLNTVTFRPITDNTQRKSGLEAGQLQEFHTNDGPTIKQLRDEAKAGKIQLVEDRGESEEGFIMFNTSKPPFDNINARKAVAYATDREAYADVVNAGTVEQADGPFTPNSPWYVDTKFPTLDIEQAKKYAAQYQTETGKPLEFDFGVGGPDSKKNGEFLQQNWSQAGIKANVNVITQDKFIVDALGGNYQANLWRQFGSPDPDGDFHWWISDNAKTALALNFARNQDPEIDKALLAGRATTDVTARKAAYKTLQERFTADMPYVWLDRALWVVAASNNVRGITNGPLPDGQPSMPIGGQGFPGVHFFTQTWLAS